MNAGASGLPFSPAAERNQGPILAQLRRLLPTSARVLEIASGSGQHAQHFANACSGWVWQPSEADAALLPAIDARCHGMANVLPAVALDVMRAPWPLGSARYGAIYGANLLHISPWPTCAALMRSAAVHLDAGARLLLYGPFVQDGVPTAASNTAFDADLRSRNPQWGLRALSDVERDAAAQGLRLNEVVSMPANNLLLVLTCKP